MRVEPAVGGAARIVDVAAFDGDLGAARIDHDAGRPVEGAHMTLLVHIARLAAALRGEQLLADAPKPVDLAVPHAHARGVLDEDGIVAVAAATLNHHVLENHVFRIGDLEDALHHVLAADNGAGLGGVADPAVRASFLAHDDRVGRGRGIDHDRPGDGDFRFPGAERAGGKGLAARRQPHLIAGTLGEIEDRTTVVGGIQKVDRRFTLLPFATGGAVFEREPLHRRGAPADRTGGVGWHEPQFTGLHRLDERHPLLGALRRTHLLPVAPFEVRGRGLKRRLRTRAKPSHGKHHDSVHCFSLFIFSC